MQPVKDELIMRMIEQIGDHFRSNISNRFIRPALMQLSLEKNTWDQVETLTEKFEQFRYQGFHLDELYRQIAATAKFIYAVRREVAPTLRYRLSDKLQTGADKILRDMAINNFSYNLQLLADLLYDLFVKLAEIDVKMARGRKPLYKQIPELADLGSKLVEI